MAKPRALRGPDLVRSLLVEHGFEAGLAPAKLAKLKFQGGAPLPPSLIVALELDADRVTIARNLVRTLKFSEWLDEALPDWAPMLANPGAKLFTARCLPLASASDSASFLYLGEPDEDGEYPVITVDADDVPTWEISAGGYDSHLVQELGAGTRLPKSDPRIGRHAKRCFAGKRRGRFQARTNVIRNEFLYFGSVVSELSAEQLRELPLVAAKHRPPLHRDLEPWFPASPDRCLADLGGRLRPPEWLETQARADGLSLLARLTDSASSGATTTLRDWLAAVAARGGSGRITLVCQENGRPFNAFVLTTQAKAIQFERQNIAGFEACLDAPELAELARPRS